MKLRDWVLVIACVLISAGIICGLSGCKPEELGAAHPTTDDFYDHDNPTPKEPRMWVIPKTQTDEEIQKKSVGCMSCHKGIENPSMHESTVVKIGCTDCHGGNAQSTIKEAAHVHPRGHWYSQTPTLTKEWKLNKSDAPAATKEGAAESGTSSLEKPASKE